MKLRKLLFILLCMTIIILPSCGEPEPDHEQLLSEICENNRIKNEKRKEFMESEIYQTASLYIDSTLEDCFPDHEYEFTLEPGTFYNTELPAYSDFSENEVTRKEFFSKAYLSIYVKPAEDDNTNMQAAAKKLVDKQISGRINSDRFNHDYYKLDAEKGTAELVLVPEV